MASGGTPPAASMSPNAGAGAGGAGSPSSLGGLGGERVVNTNNLDNLAGIPGLGGAMPANSSLASLLGAAAASGQPFGVGAGGARGGLGAIGQHGAGGLNVGLGAGANPGNLSALLSALQQGAGTPGTSGTGTGPGNQQQPSGWNALTGVGNGGFPAVGTPGSGPGGVNVNAALLGGLSAAGLAGAAGMAGLGVAPGAGGGAGQQQVPIGAGGPQTEEDKIYALILDLTNPAMREGALLELSKKREAYEDLAPILWHSFGVISALLQEIISVYPILFPPTLTGHASNRVCNTLALLQCVASHPETRGLFLNAHIPLFLYPFLNTTSKTRPFEYLRLTSLGVIGALVKNDNTEVIQFLLSTEIVPLCLRIMESGSELSKTVAIFIVQKILLDDAGLSYICQTYERFFAVATVLNTMVSQLIEGSASGQNAGGRLLKHVVRCYLRLSDNPRAREALRQCLPDPLRDGTFSVALKDDMTTRRCLQTLLSNLGEGGAAGAAGLLA